jgi:ABC-type branched-subunit amino acid transport system substrate-binding protein
MTVGFVSQDSVGIPILSKAGIPSFTTLQGQGTASPWAEVTTGSATITLTVPARYACAQGYHKVSVLTSDLPIARTDFSQFAAGIYKQCGIDVNVVYVPLTAADPAPYVQKAITTKPDLLIDTILTGASVDPQMAAITTAGYPINRTYFGSGGVDTAFFSNPATKGAMLGFPLDIAIPQNTNPDVQAYVKALKQFAPGTDPLGTFTPIAFSQVVTIWKAAQAIGFNKVTGPEIKDYMLNQAQGNLQVPLGRVVTLVPGYPGMKQPYFHVVRWTGTGIDSLGWWSGWGSCSSQASCAAGMKTS